MTMILTASRFGAFPSLEAASKAASGVLRAVAQSSNVRGLWLSTDDGPRIVDAALIDEMLVRGELESWRSPRGFTNAVSVHLLPTANEVGTVLVRVGEPIVDAPALAVCLRVDPERFDVSPDGLLALARACAESSEFDEVSLMPRAWRVQDRLAWARWTKAGARASGASRTVRCAGGEIRVAHRRAPNEDGPDARRDAGAMRSSVAVVEQAPAVAASDAATSEASAGDLDGTSELRDAFVAAPALPFTQGRGQTPEAGAAPSKAGPRMATGTEDVDVAKLRAMLLPFARAASARVAGSEAKRLELTLDQYALLRASLTIHGEEDAATLAQFGIASPDEKRAIQARFAALFRSDPPAQERFVALVRRFTESLPRSGLPPEPAKPAPEPDLDATAELGAARSIGPWPFQSTAPLPTPSQPPEPESKKRGS